MSCAHCADTAALGFEITFAFQPIVDVRDGSVFSHEALVRGTGGESAGEFLRQVNADNRYAFDQTCRRRAIELAARLAVRSKLNINFLPKAVYEPKNCIQATLAASREHNFPIEQIVFEITEGERVEDHDHLARIIREYQSLGFGTAIDDFGAGYSGLNLLADYQPGYLKLDMALTRDIDRQVARQSIVRGIVMVCRELKIELIAEGIETPGELTWLRGAGVHLIQGYLLAKPGFEHLPDVNTAALGYGRWCGRARPGRSTCHLLFHQSANSVFRRRA